MKRLVVLGLVLLLIAVAVMPTAAQDRKAVTIAWGQELDNLNPMYSTMSFVTYTLDLYISRPWVYDEELNIRPVLLTEMPSAENGGISEDGTVITLNLRDDAVWSDGDALDSADFVFTYEMIMADSNTPITRFPYDTYVTSVEAPDAQTVVVTFNAPYAAWQAQLFSYVLPEHILRPTFEADGTIDNAEWNREPRVGSGPFVFDEWEVGSFIRFIRNDNYFNGGPNLDIVVVEFIPDSVSYVLALANEDADIGTFFDYPDIEQIEESGANTVQVLPSGYNEAWFFNVDPATAHPALLDVNVRQAVAMGFDRFSITEDLLLGRTYPADSFWENTPYDNEAVEAPAYDPAMAAQLLDEAGWVDSNGDGTRDKDGVELVLRYITNQRQIRVDVQAIAQQQLAEIGVGVELINYPSDQYFLGYSEGGPQPTGQYDIAELSTNPAFPDPDSSRFLCTQRVGEDNPSGSNWQGYCNEELDALFAQQATEVDPAARIEIFHQIDEILVNDYVWVSVWHDPDLWSYNTRIQNIKLNAVNPLWNINEWDV